MRKKQDINERKTSHFWKNVWVKWIKEEMGNIYIWKISNLFGLRGGILRLKVFKVEHINECLHQYSCTFVRAMIYTIHLTSKVLQCIRKDDILETCQVSKF